ncbi:Nodulation receptor kinase [Linum grandiflorum]
MKMMGIGGSHSWRLRSVDSLILCLLILFVPSAPAQQEGFISINCCGRQGRTDSSSVPWTSDEQWYPDETGCLVASSASENYTGNDRVRFFYIENSEKRCYSLTTTQDRDYLIRGTFPSGKSVGSVGSTFDVLVGVTPISLVKSSGGYTRVEAVFRATEQHIDFCLVHETGDPYISQLELRPLQESRYLDGRDSIVLKLVDRVDLGNIGTPVRFPDDPQDRIWSSPDTGRVNLSTMTTINNTITNPAAEVPERVLETAVTDETNLQFFYADLEKRDSNYTIILYFFELDDSVRPGQRVFDIYINNEKQQMDFDIRRNGSNYSEVALNVTANGYLNLTLSKVNNKSNYGPILNAYEILQVYQWIQGTNQRDVRVMEKVKDGLLEQNKGNKKLESWSGDPCQPSSWEGVACHYSNGSTIITKLDISSSRLQGKIPTTTAQLIYLKELNLSNNRFFGNIPEFPRNSMLTSVDLRHNALSRNLPDSLVTLPQLRVLYYGCNVHVSAGPSKYNLSRLTTDSGRCIRLGSRKKQKLVLIVGVCGSLLIAVAVVSACVWCYRKKFGARRNINAKKLPTSKGAVFSITATDEDPLRSINIQMFTLNYIGHATQKYKTLIGEGGFGAVYRGTLPDGTEVAVKVRSSTSTQGTKEFENELNLLSAIQHENLVRLLGYCSENDQQILVYPFMSNGSLQDRLYGEAAKRKTLDWPTRLSIALGAARGLTYLHTFAERCVIHRDVKSSNILLDHSMNAKVADFGFSKYAPQEGDSGVSLEVRGTAGYLDPEYYSTQHLTAKSDVFSFGVVLLEIISGREPLNIQRPRNEWSLVEWAKPYIRESRIDEIVDPGVKGLYHAEAMWRVVEVALACIETSSAYRPCMSDIVRELEDALIIENNASEYMKSIDSIGTYSLGGSNRFSMDKKPSILPAPPPTPPEPSPDNAQAMAPVAPR